VGKGKRLLSQFFEAKTKRKSQERGPPQAK